MASLRFEFLFSLFVASCWGNTLPLPKASIEANPHEFPFMVYIGNPHMDPLYRFCMGAILNEEWIITHNSCADQLSSSVTIYAGDHNPTVNEGTEQTRGVIRTIRHPEHEKMGEFIITLQGEVALMQMDTPLLFNEYVRSVPLATPSIIYSSSNVTKLHWLNNGAVQTNLMKNIYQSFMTDQVCEAYLDPANTFPYQVILYPDTIICAGTFDFFDVLSCSNVYGQIMMCDTLEGPVVCGIGHYYSYECRSSLNANIGTPKQSVVVPSIFSQISYFNEWIVNRSTLKEESNETFVHQEDTCGGVVTGTSGCISYKPGQPLDPNQRCVWTIRAEDFSSVRIHFDSVPNMGTLDTLVISDFYGEFPGEFSDFYVSESESNTTDFRVRGPVVFITLASGQSTEAEGFSLEFYASGYDQALSFNMTNVHLNQSGTTYHYPETGNYYPWWGAGSFVINPSGVQDFNMAFSLLKITCIGDQLFIYKWSQDLKRHVHIETICERDGLPIYETTDGIFIILFTSDDSVLGSGFTIDF